MVNPSIDESPISPAPTDRRNSLEKHLQSRPDPRDLMDRHILLKTNVAPSIQATQQDLERNRTSDNLKKHLERRPVREDLIERNILPDLNTAPALLANARELEKHMLADSLEQKIQNRPRPEDLISQGILDGTEDPRTP